MAASVWSNPSSWNPGLVWIERSVALITPTVTVLTNSPSGEPMAITVSPDFSSSELPQGATAGTSPSTLTTARSANGSTPIRVAGRVVPFERVTSRLSAFSTTWLLVTTYPSEEMITPDPEAVGSTDCPKIVRCCGRWLTTVTTAGETRSTESVTAVVMSTDGHAAGRPDGAGGPAAADR